MSNLLKTGKKAVTVVVVMTTIMWSVGVFALPAAFAATSGDLIKIKCTGQNSTVCQAVYYLGANGKRYVFPNEKTYKTWYADFQSVKEISQTEMESYPIGGNATYRPALKMVKITTDPKVYAVAKGGTLRWVNSEAVATALYGSTWNKQIEDVPDVFFTNYTLGSDISVASSYDKAAETAGSTSINVDKNLSGGGPVTGGSTITVALASDTPASGIVMGSAARVPFTTLTLTASSDGDVVVDSVSIVRGGIAQDGAFADFDLLDASTMLPLNGLSKSLNSSHEAIFSDDITVAAGTTKKVIVSANMTTGLLSSYAGETPTVGVSAIVLKGGATLVGALPITGNYQNVNGTMTVGTAAIAVGANSPAASTKEVGSKDYIVSSIKISNNSTATGQDFTVKSVTFTQNGSAAPEDLQNIRLINTNTSETLGTVASPTSKKISFTGLNLSVKKGNNITLDLRLDIKSGSARTVSLDVDQKSDVVIYDVLRSSNVVPSYTNSASAAVTSSPYYNPSDTTIGNGKLRIESLAITSNKIAENAKKVLIGKFKFVVEGEKVNITSMGFKVTTSTASTGNGIITNLVSQDASGASLTSAKDPVLNIAGQLTATSTDTVSLPVGDTTVMVYGNLDANFIANDTVQVGIFPEGITVRGDVSGNLITPTPAGQVQSTSLNVKAAALAVSVGTTPASQTVVAGTPNLEVAQLILDASDSGMDIRVTQVGILVKDTSAQPNILDTIKIYDGATEVPVNSSSQTCSGTTCSVTGRATTTLSISAGNLKITKGTTKVLSVRGNVGTADTSGSFYVELVEDLIAAIDEEGQTVTETYTAGTAATMTLSSGGTLQISLGTDPKAALVVAGTTVEIGKFIAKAKYEGMNISDIGFQIVANTETDIDGAYSNLDQIELWEQGGSAALGTQIVNAARATITAPVTLTLDQEKTYVVKAKFKALTSNASAAAQSGEGIMVKLSYIYVKGTAVGSSSVTTNGIGDNFKAFSEFKSIPTVTVTPFTGTGVITGNDVTNLLKFNIKADAMGPVAIGKFTFGVSTTVIRVAHNGYYLYESASSSSLGTLLTSTGDFLVTVIGTSATPVIVEARFDVNNDSTEARNEADITESYIVDAGATRYFTLRGTLSGHDATVSNESVSVVLAGDAAFASTVQTNFGAIDGTVDQDDFIWSDLNFDQYSSSTATMTLGWFNGYRVSGLEDTSTTPQTLGD